MEKNLEEYLNKNKISFKIYRHPEIFTVSQAISNPVIKKIPGLRTKSLFLKDDENRYYLITLPGSKRLNTKFLKKHLEIKSLNFASPEELWKELGIKPGSVSMFCVINSRDVCLILDKEVYESEEAGFHPNINTETIVLEGSNIKRFYNSWHRKKEIISLP